MKYLLFTSCLVILSFSNCDKDIKLQDSGQITGQDISLCACCGGWFIEINSKTYRFYELPQSNDINLDTETFPLNVQLDWRAEDPACLGDEIVVDKIIKD